MAVVIAVLAPCFVGVSAFLFGLALVSGASLSVVAQAGVLLVSVLIMQLLAYLIIYEAGQDSTRDKEEEEPDVRAISLKSGQSIAFRLMPGRDSYVTVLPGNPPGQWTTTRIEPADENKDEA